MASITGEVLNEMHNSSLIKAMCDRVLNGRAISVSFIWSHTHTRTYIYAFAWQCRTLGKTRADAQSCLLARHSATRHFGRTHHVMPLVLMTFLSCVYVVCMSHSLQVYTVGCISVRLLIYAEFTHM